MIRFTTVSVGGSPMTLLVAMPYDAGEGPVPALVLMPHRAGIDIFTVDRAERLAAEGIAVAAPDVYHRQPVAVPTQEGKDRLRDDELEADIGAALAFLQADLRVDPARIGIMGHCQGGRTALLGLVAYPGAFCLGCIYYGGSVFAPWGGAIQPQRPSPFDRLSAVRCPVAGFFGNEDKNPSPADVDRLDAEMTRLGIPHRFYRYDGAGHAFQDFTDTRRGRAPQAAQAWGTTLAILKRELWPVA